MKIYSYICDWEDDDMMEEYDDMMEGLERSMKEPFYMVRHNEIYQPAPLKKGDKIGIVSL